MKKLIILMTMFASLLQAEEGTVMMEILYENNNYKIKDAWKIKHTFPNTAMSPYKSENDIIIVFKDENKKIIDTLNIENPRIVRGILNQDKTDEGHKNFINKKGSFIVRHKYIKGMKYINIKNSSENVNFREKSNIHETSVDMDFGSLL